jgi:hypothetical protein
MGGWWTKVGEGGGGWTGPYMEPIYKADGAKSGPALESLSLQGNFAKKSTQSQSRYYL